MTFAAAVAGLSVDEDDKDACMEEIDGQLVENLADCSTYYSCKDQIPEKKECMDDLLFDAKNLTCALPDTVTTCENVIEWLELDFQRILIIHFCFFHLNSETYKQKWSVSCSWKGNFPFRLPRHAGQISILHSLQKWKEQGLQAQSVS